MKLILGLSLLMVSLPASMSAAAAAEEHFIEHEGVQRRYLLHLPPNWARQTKASVIVMLHGGGSNPDRARTVGLDKYADPQGFIIVYPAGLNRGWNDGRPIKGRTADDVGFLSALIDQLAADYNADTKRIYATGMSNGGFMSFALACRLAEKVRAIAPVAGSMAVGSIGDCHPSRSVSVMMINGTADPLVKFEGGKVLGRQGSESEPISKVVDFWRRQECGTAKAKIEAQRLPDVDRQDDSTVEIERVKCNGVAVTNYTVHGGGHTWSGGMQYAPRKLAGPVNRDFSASQAIVEFFAGH